jgi:CHAT domain-containing protein
MLGVRLEPLPGAAEEVETLGALFPEDRRKVFTRGAAREKAVKDPGLLGATTILHLATHGMISEEDPCASALVLGSEPDGSEDGLLEVREVFALHGAPDLVVLSACSTGLGELAGGEGILGFARAFLAAGAGDVTVSLWSVHDEAALALMPLFYKGIVAGGRPAEESLREAKIAYLKGGFRKVDVTRGGLERGGLKVVPKETPDPRHPFFWAPCVIVGRGGRTAADKEGGGAR